ncbi:MAG: aminopeptidase [Candidatus Thorarchaeota archaeon]
MDPRIREHAKILVNWSTEVKKGDMVGILTSPKAYDLALAITKEVAKAGGRSLPVLWDHEISRAFFDGADDETIQLLPKHILALVESVDVIIFIGSPMNSKALAGVSPEKQMLDAKTMQPIMKTYLSKRWVATLHPCQSLAQTGNMSLEEYQDFAYDAMLIDWKEQSKTVFKLKERLEKQSCIQFIGPETDLYASTEGRIWIAGDGKHNMPCGEVFTAPVEDTVEGKIYFDIPLLSFGKVLEGVRLAFEKGEVVDFSAEKEEATLKQVIDTDEGSRRLGEMAIGTNRGIKRATLNMLYDEKLGDTIHCALGQAYEDANGTNKSAVHVDIIKSMKEGEVLAGDDVIYSKGKYFFEM